eukprot:646696-Amphidinium_carterae.3
MSRRARTLPRHCAIESPIINRFLFDNLDREIKLEVMRIGQVSQSASVRYVTEDMNICGFWWVVTLLREGTRRFSSAAGITPVIKRFLPSHDHKDSTAKAGLKYVHTEGTLEFLPGQATGNCTNALECEKLSALNHFSVPIIDDPDWGTIAEFKVSLRNAKNGRLGCPAILHPDAKTADVHTSSYEHC